MSNIRLRCLRSCVFFKVRYKSKIFRTRKVRPKTSHSKPRRHKNVKNFKQDELDKKIKELNKVYGELKVIFCGL